jgi:hypothetical protein
MGWLDSDCRDSVFKPPPPLHSAWFPKSSPSSRTITSAPLVLLFNTNIETEAQKNRRWPRGHRGESLLVFYFPPFALFLLLTCLAAFRGVLGVPVVPVRVWGSGCFIPGLKLVPVQLRRFLFFIYAGHSCGVEARPSHIAGEWSWKCLDHQARHLFWVWFWCVWPGVPSSCWFWPPSLCWVEFKWDVFICSLFRFSVSLFVAWAVSLGMIPSHFPLWLTWVNHSSE